MHSGDGNFTLTSNYLTRTRPAGWTGVAGEGERELDALVRVTDDSGVRVVPLVADEIVDATLLMRLDESPFDLPRDAAQLPDQ